MTPKTFSLSLSLSLSLSPFFSSPVYSPNLIFQIFINQRPQCEAIYLRKSTASPETSFFLFTKALHPVVSKCLRGCPAQDKRQ